MLQNQIPLHKIPNTSFERLQETSPLLIKCNNQFKLNCRNAIKQSKLHLPKIPIINKSIHQRCVNTQRSPKIKFIKEIQKQIQTFENRHKVKSLFRNFSRQNQRNQQKENLSKVQSFSKIRVQLEPLEEEKVCNIELISNTEKIERKPSEYLPKCRVGKVRYKVEKTTRNFWEEINVSEIEIKYENQEETGTLRCIEAEMKRDQ